MPDWVENKLYVSGSEHMIAAFDQDIQNQYKQIYIDRKDKKIAKGTCKYFNTQKGFGFITVDAIGDERYDEYNPYDDDGNDIFVHCYELHANGAKILQKDEYVEFEIMVQSDGRKKAINVTGPNGRYINGNYEFWGGIDRNLKYKNTNIKIFCYELKKIECNNNDSMIYTFSTTFNAPRKWLQCVATKYSNLSFKLNFEGENEKRFGSIIWEKGKCINKSCINIWDIWDKYESELQLLLITGMRNIFEIPIRKQLEQYSIFDNIQNEILSFCPQFRLDTLHRNINEQFMKIWREYANNKIVKVSDEEYKMSKNKPLINRINNYCIIPSNKNNIFSNLFESMENKINLIFYQENIEILDYRMSIQYGFWGLEYGRFAGLVEKMNDN